MAIFLPIELLRKCIGAVTLSVARFLVALTLLVPTPRRYFYQQQVVTLGEEGE